MKLICCLQPPVPPMHSIISAQPGRPPLPPQPIITQQPVASLLTSPPVASLIPATPVWVVTPQEKIKYDALFASTDADRDGFVSGPEIKDVFLQSGVPQKVLAHIWYVSNDPFVGKANFTFLGMQKYLGNLVLDQ